MNDIWELERMQPWPISKRCSYINLGETDKNHEEYLKNLTRDSNYVLLYMLAAWFEAMTPLYERSDLVSLCHLVYKSSAL
jgi:hypothetical protein